jgi:hypothetical protein
MRIALGAIADAIRRTMKDLPLVYQLLEPARSRHCLRASSAAPITALPCYAPQIGGDVVKVGNSSCRDIDNFAALGLPPAKHVSLTACCRVLCQHLASRRGPALYFAGKGAKRGK